MRLALYRPLASLSVETVLHSAVCSACAGFTQHDFFLLTTQRQSRGYTSKKEGKERRLGSETGTFRSRKLPSANKDDGHGKGAIERSGPDASQAHAGLSNAQRTEGIEKAECFRSVFRPDLQTVRVTRHNPHSSTRKPRIQLGLASEARTNNEGWRSCLVTSEQYRHESNVERLTFYPRLVDRPAYAQDWELWLELIVFRRRHHGAKGTMAIYKEIIRRKLRLPTQGALADQLWDLLIRACFHDIALVEEILDYAIRLKRSTGRSWPAMYYGIVSVALKKDPNSAYSWHMKLREDFSPSLRDYQKLFKLSLDWGRSAHFKGLYLDTPLNGMYKTVIWQLCERQMYAEALSWHDLLCKVGDFPAEFNDIQPLLDHLVYTGDRPRFEDIGRQLAEAKVSIWNEAEDLDHTGTAISRETMNRQLGQVHGVTPKLLSDSFCARVFATQLFSVDTVIDGLHMMAVEAIGSLSLREIAVRDNCDPGTICHHIDRLQNAGISLDGSTFCMVVRNLAIENKRAILESIMNCDLHPDTFADYGLQERLLAQYFEENDLLKIERTLAVLTTGCSFGKMQLVQSNLILRCQVTLGRREKVVAMLEEMKQMGIPVSPRSSRHLRLCWLSRRQVGRGPETTRELAVLIQASQSTMQSGRFVPIKAWREIMRRLGMAARLQELENLALWLVEWYSSPAARAALPKHLLSSGHGRHTFIESHASPRRLRSRHPQHFLSTLFTTAAQHAMVAWGFQHMLRPGRRFRGFKETSTAQDVRQFQGTPRFQWTWGLHLLYKLRERGVPVQRSEVARICRKRLNTLFGPGLSNRKINRRARTQMKLEYYTISTYVRKMEEIWGEGLFRVWRRGKRKGRNKSPRSQASSKKGKNMKTDAHEKLQIVQDTQL